MPSIEYDLKYLQAGLLDLEGYLLSNELYWPIGVGAPAGDPPFPRLTLGGLLVSRTRLEGLELNQEQQTELQRLSTRMDETRSQWRVAWGHKASREFTARLNLWRDFLEDYREKPAANVDRYPYEVRRRVMLELLGPDADAIPAAEAELRDGLDKLLKSIFVPGDFVWDSNQMNSFPKGKYWYLYGQPKEE